MMIFYMIGGSVLSILQFYWAGIIVKAIYDLALGKPAAGVKPELDGKPATGKTKSS